MPSTRDRGRGTRTDAWAVGLAGLGGASLAWATAWVIRRQQQLLADLAAAQARLAEQAADAERARIARDLHDVIAHTLTVTMLHLSSARLALADRPGDAAQALAEAERLGRESLTDVRRVVGVLGAGRGDGGRVARPLPTAGDLPELVEEYRTAGVDIRMAQTGDVERLAPATGLAVYRIVEESLANAARHAPGTTVHLDLDAGNGTEVRLRVVNLLRGERILQGASEGLGLVGMRERAGLLGGRVVAGPEGGNWSVDVVLPLGAGEP